MRIAGHVVLIKTLQLRRIGGDLQHMSHKLRASIIDLSGNLKVGTETVASGKDDFGTSVRDDPNRESLDSLQIDNVCEQDRCANFLSKLSIFHRLGEMPDVGPVEPPMKLKMDSGLVQGQQVDARGQHDRERRQQRFGVQLSGLRCIGSVGILSHTWFQTRLTFRGILHAKLSTRTEMRSWRTWAVRQKSSDLAGSGERCCKSGSEVANFFKTQPPDVRARTLSVTPVRLWNAC
mmetsp:Transcript_18074/g.48049  ORF Transcript_18074/g.48049 Transcript_18074/m.48049 type:complete len:234 (-) Transcript_18074:2289-2990(-)